MDNEFSEDIKPLYQKLNEEYENIKIGNAELKIKDLNILKEEQNYWIILSNLLFGNTVNVEKLIFEIELRYPIPGFILFYSDIKNFIKNKLDACGEKNVKEVRNELIKTYWSKLKKKTRKYYSKKEKEFKIKYDLDRILVKKFLMLYYDPYRRNVCDPNEMFADSMIIFIKLNKIDKKLYSNKYISLKKLKKYFLKIYDEIDEKEDEILYSIKKRCINNYNYLSNLFDDANHLKLEFIEDIKIFNYEDLENNIIYKPVDIFKKDLLNGKMKEIVPLYEQFYKKLDKNIKSLYKIKAQKLNLLNKYKQKLYYYY